MILINKCLLLSVLLINFNCTSVPESLKLTDSVLENNENSDLNSEFCPMPDLDPLTPSGCYRKGPESDWLISFRPKAKAWYDSNVCPLEMEVWMCDYCHLETHNCVSIGGVQVENFKPACCAPIDGPAFTCTPTNPPEIPSSECPQPIDKCHDSVCLSNGKCSITNKLHWLKSCADPNDPSTINYICTVKPEGGPAICTLP